MTVGNNKVTKLFWSFCITYLYDFFHEQPKATFPLTNESFIINESRIIEGLPNHMRDALMMFKLFIYFKI